jgi:hypothetical protein
MCDCIPYLIRLYSNFTPASYHSDSNKMKLVTANFLTCAVKGCKTSSASFPLHFHDAELELEELDFQPEFIRNIIPRVDWDGLRVTANEVRSDVSWSRWHV